MKNQKIAKSREEWWSLIKADHQRYNGMIAMHEDDRMGLYEYISNLSSPVHGWEIVSVSDIVDIRFVKA